ncbi:hypothetical protein HOO54_15495 [Bacillus sp. WMMC1349]|uniref:hypothetical protein n=1 Tax=Bacillus sp. WMMC1349 TaxID=2736254 RepID=UPI00155757F4|nr:hypothetical protein [Bacillus sp. WMMC1349]NPC93602.1 hypothetical protein [Bacillus sp. WMMC1349]
MRLYIKRLWSGTPTLTPQQTEHILDIYERPFTPFEDGGRAYRIGFNTALTCFGYLIADKDTES